MNINKGLLFEYPIGKCPRCGRNNRKLMVSNNPLNENNTICFECINQILDYKNIEHADMFCRTFNLVFRPTKWIEIAEKFGNKTFEVYTQYCFENENNRQNLYYTASTADVWAKVNKEWEKTRSFYEVLSKIEAIKDGYIARGHLKWGPQYTFEELYKLDTQYVKTIKANNVINPLQKDAVQKICKVNIELDKAILNEDAKAIKDFSATLTALSKQADLDTMIQNTRTDDITTISDLTAYLEEKGFQPDYDTSYDKDEVDTAIKDIQNTNGRLIREATGLQSEIDQMIHQRASTLEEQDSVEATADVSLEELIAAKTDVSVDTESDDEALNMDFSDTFTGVDS